MEGSPISPASAAKVRLETDWTSQRPSGLRFVRRYLSTWGMAEVGRRSTLGKGWRHNHEIELSQWGTGVKSTIFITLEEGQVRAFSRPVNATSWTPEGHNDALSTDTAGRWIYRRATHDDTLIFSAAGKLLTRTLRNGWQTAYNYDGQGRLSMVTDNFGQTLSLGYHSTGRLASITATGAQPVNYGYDAEGRLTKVSHADGTTRTFLYENPAYLHALTGIIDESGVRWATFGYDSTGKAVSTELAGSVFRYAIGYPAVSGAATSVTDPLGTVRNFNYSTINGKLVVVGADKHDALGRPDASSRVQNAQGLITAQTDFLGTGSVFEWDAMRRLPLAVTEAVGKPESRTTQTTWHPQWRLPLSITEPGRTTTYTYDSLGNPLTQTITDTGGGSGNSGTTRTTTWTYHASGLVATETAPNGATTSYQYDSAGNLTSATNALGHVDAYTHDGAGRVLTHTAPTGLVSTYTYDARGRMLTANRGGQLTTLTYRPSGQVATASLPHGHVIAYTYDAAQRMTGWSDNRGNSGAYTLDAMGNRTREEVRNAQSQVAWMLARSINSLNRVESTTVGGQQTTTYGFDANGETVRSTNGANESTHLGLDALRRIKTITNAANATASLTYNALDAITQATDFKGVATTYTRDSLGNATSETSPDSGSESSQYDALGLPSTVTDALGHATHIERDLLGRPTLISHSGGSTTTLRYDLTPASKGYLGEIVDTSGTTTYQRDNFGRVTTKTQALISGTPRSVSYAYNPQGLLASTTYPGGQVLQHVYDTTGQLTGLTWAGQPLVTGITWNPLGQPTGWSWSLPGAATAIPATRSYNTAGQLTATEFSSYQYNSAGRITSLTQNLWQPGSSNPLESTLAQADTTWTVQYDTLGRITQMGDNVRTTTYQYDANGNRTASVQTTTTGTSAVISSISRAYGTAAGHNRLLGFEQTAAAGGNSATTNVTYQYNAAGDLLGDGLRSYAYDSQGRMESATTGEGTDAPKTKYAHNALGQRVFKTEPLYSAAGKPANTKNLNNLLADDDEPVDSNAEQGFIQQLVNFFSKLWSPATSDAEKLGWTYVYAEDGSLLAEYGEGSAATSGSAQYLWLPTANGPMPIAAVVNGQTYAVHSDHLNTPRKLTQANGQAVWQWAYSAFGDEQPTTAAKRFTSEMTNPTTGTTSTPEVTFNLRYPGQYLDKETGLHYNYFRTYAPGTGRYAQGDPIGLDGGWNRFAYVGGNPLSFTDPTGLAMQCTWVGLALVCENSRPPIDPELPPPPPITFPDLIKPIKDFINWCLPSAEKNCEALRQSILNTCASLSGSKRARCVAAANESYRQCMSER